MTVLISCTNCCYNGLQLDGMGSAGYCVRHRVVLHRSNQLTCGQLFRKDLLLPSAVDEQRHHLARFNPQRIVALHDRTLDVYRSGHVDSDTGVLASDPVAREVADYGLAGTKIESLARLSTQASGRAEVARHALGRMYVRNCIARGGAWTSGLHLLRWTKAMLAAEPYVEWPELTDSLLPLPRAMELTKWSIVMLRLTFLSDIGFHAPMTESVAALRDLPEHAAAALDEVALEPLLAWLKIEGAAIIERALPDATYYALAAQLHQDRDQDQAPPVRKTRAPTTRASEPRPRLARSRKRKPDLGSE